jgi:hypothetical protein
MNVNAAQRLNRVVEGLFQKLGQQFYIQKHPDEPRVAFGVVEKMPPGQIAPGGGKFKLWGKITFKQLEMIEATSQLDDELEMRIRKFVFEGIDTTRIAEPKSFSAEQVEEMVRKQVNLILTKQQELMEAARIDEIAKKAARDSMIEEVKRVPAKSGIQAKKRIGLKAAQAKNLADLDMWKQRAEILGLGAPILCEGGRKVDGRWARHAQKQWEAHLAANPAETVATE